MRAIIIPDRTARFRRKHVRARQHRVRGLRNNLELTRRQCATQTFEQLARRMDGDAPGKFLFDNGSIYDITTLSPGRNTLTVVCGATVAHAALNISPA